MKKLEYAIEQKLIGEQIELAKHIEIQPIQHWEKIRYVAGLDTAYWEVDNIEYCGCVCIIYDMDLQQVIENTYSVGKVNFPYISGFLAYREADIGINTIKKLNAMPDIIMVDGNGMLHPRKAGEAVKIGVKLGIPTIGVAKKYCKIDNIEFTMPEQKKGAYTDISVHGEVLGRAVRTREKVKPAFVSIGNKITLDDATQFVLTLTTNESFLPIPTRLADLETHRLRKKIFDGETL